MVQGPSYVYRQVSLACNVNIFLNNFFTLISRFPGIPINLEGPATVMPASYHPYDYINPTQII